MLSLGPKILTIKYEINYLNKKELVEFVFWAAPCSGFIYFCTQESFLGVLGDQDAPNHYPIALAPELFYKASIKLHRHRVAGVMK